YDDYESNTGFVMFVLETLRRYSRSTHFINISSAAVYGDTLPTPLNEITPPKPISPYGFHKYMADQICQEFSALFGIKTTVLRAFSVYGPGNTRQLFWDVYNKMKERKELE